MKQLLVLIWALTPSLAMAHIGHLGDVAGHDHVAAGVAIGAAIAIGIWGALKGKRDADKSDDTEEAADDAVLPDEEPQEA